MWSVGKRIVLDQPGPREFFFFKAEDGIRDWSVTGVQTCALPIWPPQPVGATLAGERGAYRLGRPLPSIQVPATGQAVLAARIDRLPPGGKALLQTASVEVRRAACRGRRGEAGGGGGRNDAEEEGG